MTAGQHTYGPADLEWLIQAVWDEFWEISSSAAEDAEIKAPGSPSSGGNVIVMAVDARQAFGSITHDDQNYLRARHYYEWPLEVISDVFGLEDSHEAARLVDAAEGSMLAAMNGRTAA